MSTDPSRGAPVVVNGIITMTAILMSDSSGSEVLTLISSKIVISLVGNLTLQDALDWFPVSKDALEGIKGPGTPWPIAVQYNHDVNNRHCPANNSPHV